MPLAHPAGAPPFILEPTCDAVDFPLVKHFEVSSGPKVEEYALFWDSPGDLKVSISQSRQSEKQKLLFWVAEDRIPTIRKR